MNTPDDLTDYTLAYSSENGSGYETKIFVRRPPAIQVLIDALSWDDRHSSDSFISHAGRSIHAGLESQAVMLDPRVGEYQVKTKIRFQEVFQKAGFGSVFMQKIPNEYWPLGPDGNPSASALSDPWYLVTTFLGRIKIGWRSSVISIDWNDSALRGQDPIEKVSCEGVPRTQWGTGLHTHGYEDATRYLRVLYQKAQVLLAQESAPQES